MSVDRHPTDDLPAYALGALEESERESIATHIATCDRCTRDLVQFESALYEAAAVGAVTVEPPRDLRTRIVLRHRGARVVGAADWAERTRGFFLRPVPLFVPAVLVVLLVVAFAVVGTSRKETDAYANALAGVADGRVVALAPQEGSPDARAAVVMPARGQPYLIVRLPSPPSGKAWEAWVLKPGPVAVPAGLSEAGGVFTVTLTTPLGAGNGVAITLEPVAGSAQPTTKPVLAVDRT
jgi:anti-sigma-K factor RskA